MARLIDAEALDREISEYQGETYEFAIHEVSRAISDATTVDAVEVTRCAKCVYWKTDGCAMATTDKVTRAIGWSNGDDYCSYGERGETGK